MILLAPLLASDWTVDCPAVGSPEEYQAGDNTIGRLGSLEAGRATFEEAMRWVDVSCIASCGEECAEADCISAAGATVSYRWFVYREISYETYGTSSEGEVWYVHVTLPEGAGSPWSVMEVEGSTESSWFDDGGSESEDWHASWTGEWTWGSNGSLTSHWGQSGYDGYTGQGGSGSESWSAPGCEWSVAQRSTGDWHQYFVTTAGGDIEVQSPCQNSSYSFTTHTPLGIQDGVRGALDAETWAWTGAGDLDEDCWYDDVDCDDTNVAVHPGAIEVWYDGIDDDCDGNDADRDKDGHGWDGSGGDDCDDAHAAIHPGATDAPCDGIDSDCSGDDPMPDLDGDGTPCEACVDLGECIEMPTGRSRKREARSQPDGCAATGACAASPRAPGGLSLAFAAAWVRSRRSRR